jgi:hypothetical protein
MKSVQRIEVVFESSCGDYQQKRGWTGPLERAVSIRSRRVRSPLLREWGPKARPSRNGRRIAALFGAARDSG